jgi:hypothetical protein
MGDATPGVARRAQAVHAPALATKTGLTHHVARDNLRKKASLG